MLSLKKGTIDKVKELGYELEEDGVFYTKKVGDTEISLEEDGIIVMSTNEVNWHNSEEENFKKELIKDLIDNDLVEEVILEVGED